MNIKTDKNTYKAFDDIKVNYSGIPEGEAEWANVILASREHSEYGTWTHVYSTEGNIEFCGQPAGEYEARIFGKQDKLLAKQVFTVTAREGKPLFEVNAETKHAKFVQVFQGTNGQSSLEVVVLRLGEKEERKFIVKFGGTVDHECNGQIYLFRLEEKWARGDVDQELYWTVFDGERRNTLQGKKSGSGWGNRTMSYNVYLPGMSGIAVSFSDEQSKEISAEEFFQEYLKSMDIDTTIQNQTASPEVLYEKIETLSASVRRLEKENNRIHEINSSIEKLEKKLTKEEEAHQKSKADAATKIRELEQENNRLLKEVDTLKKDSTAKKSFTNNTEETTEQAPKPASDKKLHQGKITFSDNLKFHVDSYHRNGVRFQWYSVEIMINNREEKNDSVVGVEMDFWVNGEWQTGKPLKDRFSIPQHLPSMAPTNISAAAEIQSDDYLFPVITRVRFELFSGTFLEKEIELKPEK